MKNIILLAALLATSHAVVAQDKKDALTFKRHMVSASYGVGSFAPTESYDNSIKALIVDGTYGYRAIGRYQPEYTGTFCLSYAYRPAAQLELGADVSFLQSTDEWSLYNNPAGPEHFTHRISYLGLTPNATYTYTKGRMFDLYSSVGIGALYKWDNLDGKGYGDYKDALQISLQAWLIGFRINYHAVGVFCNLGFGSLGIARFGISMNI